MADKDGENPFAGFETHENAASSASSNEGEAASSQDTDDKADEGKSDKEQADEFDKHAEGEDGGEDGEDDGGEDGDDEGDDDGDDEGDDEGDDGDDDGDDEGDDEGDDDGQSELDLDDEGDKKKKPQKSVKARIGEITRKRRAAERSAKAANDRADAAEARALAAEKKLTGDQDNDTGEDDTTDDGPKRPDPEDFKYGEVDPEYTEALADYRIDLRLSKDAKTKADAEQAEAIEAKTAELNTQFEDTVEVGVEAYDDFEEVVIDRADKSSYPLSAEIVIMTLDSEVGHHVIYEIASTAGLAEKLAQMSPAQQGKEFGRLEAQYLSDDDTPPKKKRKATKAKPPPKKRSGSASPKQIDAGTGNFADFESKVRASQRGKKRK